MEDRRSYLSLLYDCYAGALTDRCRDALDLYYNDDLSLAEVAEHLGITRQGVRDALQRGQEQLEFLERSLGFVAREAAYKRAARSILEKSTDEAVRAEAEKILALWTREGWEGTLMFQSLVDKMSQAFSKFRNKGKLTEADVKAGMREVKLALLEADVNFKVVKDFVAKVTERAVGSEVLESLVPSQQIVKIVNE